MNVDLTTWLTLAAITGINFLLTWVCIRYARICQEATNLVLGMERKIEEPECNAGDEASQTAEPLA